MERRKFKLRKSIASVVIILITSITSMIYGQGNTWKLTGNSNVGDNVFIGSKNNSDFIIKTNNEERIRVTTKDYTIMKDSVRILGPLFIGDSSLVLGAGFNIPGGDLIRSTNGIINFGNTFMFNFSNIRIGIGLTAPQHKLHINERNPFFFGQPNPVFSAYTNQAFGSGTGITSTDGFLVGIAADGTAELRQQEDKDIILFTGEGTDNQSRMIIKGEEGDNKGFVGIGTDNPTSAFEVANGDIALTADNSGIILKAKDGYNYYRILVDNNGTLYTEQVNIK